MDEQGGVRPGDGFSDEAIRERAYEISLRDDAGTAEENWRRAEEELRGGGSSSAGGTDEAPMSGGQPSEDLPGAASP